MPGTVGNRSILISLFLQCTIGFGGVRKRKTVLWIQNTAGETSTMGAGVANIFYHSEGRFQDPVSTKRVISTGIIMERELTEPGRLTNILIAEKLGQYVESGRLHLCPFLNLERVRDIIMDPPETIQIDRVNFRPYKVDGKDVNIRHTPQHFVFSDKMVYAKRSTYNDLCMINYLAQLEHDLTIFEFSQN